MSKEQETLHQGVVLGKETMRKQVVAMFESMKSTDSTDTPYSMANVLTIAEAIEAVQKVGK